MPLKLNVPAPLDPGFQPAVLFNRQYVAKAKASGRAVPLVLGLAREGGLLSRYETSVLPELEPDTVTYAERLVKFLLWARGGWKLYFGGPEALGQKIASCFSKAGLRSFDVELMTRVYERPFEVVLTPSERVPAARELSTSLGGHLDGCRLGFDLGASDYKIAAVKDGELCFSAEFPWSPKDQADPNYHYEHLNAGLKAAAKHLPRVEAIGGSSAGVIVDNHVMVASLFRAVPADKLSQAKGLFHRLRKEWGVPVEVANDGDVTALAGSMSLKANGMLGLAMGSSEAAGYIDPRGFMTGWLSELAFAPVDYNPAAPADEWSGDRGVGALYFSQQAVGQLLQPAGIKLAPELGLPEKLKEIQELMARGDQRAARLYETIGVYLGYSIPHYADFYDFQHLLVLGRVTTGRGGEILLDKARQVLAKEFPELARNLKLHVPDEKSRRVGQAVAAASLPAI